MSKKAAVFSYDLQLPRSTSKHKKRVQFYHADGEWEENAKGAEKQSPVTQKPIHFYDHDLDKDERHDATPALLSQVGGSHSPAPASSQQSAPLYSPLQRNHTQSQQPQHLQQLQQLQQQSFSPPTIAKSSLTQSQRSQPASVSPSVSACRSAGPPQVRSQVSSQKLEEGKDEQRLNQVAQTLPSGGQCSDRDNFFGGGSGQAGEQENWEAKGQVAWDSMTEHSAAINRYIATLQLRQRENAQKRAKISSKQQMMASCEPSLPSPSSSQAQADESGMILYLASCAPPAQSSIDKHVLSSTLRYISKIGLRSSNGKVLEAALRLLLSHTCAETSTTSLDQAPFAANFGAFPDASAGGRGGREGARAGGGRGRGGQPEAMGMEERRHCDGRGRGGSNSGGITMTGLRGARPSGLARPAGGGRAGGAGGGRGEGGNMLIEQYFQSQQPHGALPAQHQSLVVAAADSHNVAVKNVGMCHESASLLLVLDGMLQEGVLSSLVLSLQCNNIRSVHQITSELMRKLLSLSEARVRLCAAPHATFVCNLLHTILAGAQDLGIDDEALMHVTDSIMLLLQHDEGMLPFSFEEGQRLLEIPSQYGTRGSNAQEKLSSCWGQFQLAFYGF